MEAAGLVASDENDEDDSEYEALENEAVKSEAHEAEDGEDETGDADEDELLVTSGDAFVPAWSEFAHDMEDLQVQLEVAGKGIGGAAEGGGKGSSGSEGVGPLGAGDLA